MLQQILDSVRANLAPVVASVSEHRARALDRPPARDFGGALRAPGLQVIAEIKRRSPSAGEIAAGMDPAAQAARYEKGGAAAISVLTEPNYFGGSLEDLGAARGAVDLPVLRKDFILDPAQIWQSRAAGADAILLIVAALTTGELEELAATAAEAGLSALVEAHTREEAAAAMSAGATIVGVNNRDLRRSSPISPSLRPSPRTSVLPP